VPISFDEHLERGDDLSENEKDKQLRRRSWKELGASDTREIKAAAPPEPRLGFGKTMAQDVRLGVPPPPIGGTTLPEPRPPMQPIGARTPPEPEPVMQRKKNAMKKEEH
jgi:hypothetical protein